MPGGDPISADRQRLAQPALQAAPLLLGARVVTRFGGQRVVARITEVEAYEGADDPASHAFRGRTRRNEVMFGEAGHLYCYFVYGMHWCANVVCGVEGVAAGVLLRAGDIVEGAEIALSRSGPSARTRRLGQGPARLARSLGLTGDDSGADLLGQASEVRLELAPSVSGYLAGPRVGVAAAAKRPWRFWLPDEPSVSSYRRAVERRRLHESKRAE